MAKRVCFYSLLVGVCLMLSYIESLFPFDFIAPGVKIGLSNAVCLILLYKGDTKGAFCVNIVRILLSCLLFATPLTLVYSLCGGVGSMLAVLAVKRIKCVSVVGASAIGGAVHNLLQLAVATAFLGKGVLYYGAVLTVAGTLCGGAVGVAVLIILKKVKTNRFF